MDNSEYAIVFLTIPQLQVKIMPATLALIAHDRKKDDLVNFIKKHEGIFYRYRPIATGTTGQRIQQNTNLTVTCLLSGRLGGDAQIAAQVAERKVGAVIFLIDPLEAQPHEPDIQTLQRVCAVHNIPLATNLATAEALMIWLRQSQIAHLIFNPISGTRNSDEDLKLIRGFLEPAMHLEIHCTTPEITAEELTRQAIEAEADLIIASGGDGTVSAVAGALLGTKIPLGIIPRGTANAFAVALGIASPITPIRTACQTIINGTTRIVDAARCNGYPMILLAGIGFEAETVERASRELKQQWGALAYIMAGWQQMSEQELFDTELEIDGAVQTIQAGAITIANAAPPTSILAQGEGRVIMDDGLLEVTITTANTKLQALKTMINLFGSALTKSANTLENTMSVRARQVKVKTTPPQKVVLDGEIIGMTPLEVECIPQGLTVLVPGGSETN